MIKNITVVGAGTMGHGIAHVFARAGYQVTLCDTYAPMLEIAPEKMRQELQFMADENYILQETVEETLNNITICASVEEATRNADYVIEAVRENLQVKKDLLAQLDKVCPKHTVFASNTSSLKLGEITADLPPERKKMCMISHWYNPAYLIPIAELSKFGNMPEDVFQDVYDMYVKAEKKPVCVHKDVPGMIANRLLHALAREAFHLVETGVGDPKDVDNALKFGPCFRNATTGMLEVADMGGLDIWLAGEDNIFPALDTSAQACDTMRKLVEEGNLGIKSGKGFYEYPGDSGAKAQNAFYKRLIVQLKASKNY